MCKPSLLKAAAWEEALAKAQPVVENIVREAGARPKCRVQSIHVNTRPSALHLTHVFARVQRIVENLMMETDARYACRVQLARANTRPRASHRTHSCHILYTYNIIVQSACLGRRPSRERSQSNNIQCGKMTIGKIAACNRRVQTQGQVLRTLLLPVKLERRIL